MPKTYLLKKIDPSHSIWKGRKDDAQMRFCGESIEDARQNAANYTLVVGKRFAPSPWKDPKLTSCVLEYAGHGVAGVSDKLG